MKIFKILSLFYVLVVPVVHYFIVLPKIVAAVGGPASAPSLLGLVVTFPSLWFQLIVGVVAIPYVVFSSASFLFGGSWIEQQASVAAIYYAGYLPIALFGAFVVEDRSGIPLAYRVLSFGRALHPAHREAERATRSADAPSFDGSTLDGGSAEGQRGKYDMRREAEEFRRVREKLRAGEREFSAREEELAAEEAALGRAWTEAAEAAEAAERAKRRLLEQEREARRRGR